LNDIYHSSIHSFIHFMYWVRKVTYTSIYTIYNNIPSRCVVRSSIELNKQANIRLEKNRWWRTIRVFILFWIYMCCYCIILSRTRSYRPVCNMSVWCLKWTLRWRVRAQPLVEYCPCVTILWWWVTHWHLHYSYSFIHSFSYSFVQSSFQLSISGMSM